jgi:hypothetical protein
MRRDPTVCVEADILTSLLRGVLHFGDQLQYLEHLLRGLAGRAQRLETGEEVVRLIGALALEHAIGQESTDLTRALIFQPAVDVETVDQRLDYAIVQAPELFSAQLQVKSCDRPKLQPG